MPSRSSSKKPVTPRLPSLSLDIGQNHGYIISIGNEKRRIGSHPNHRRFDDQQEKASLRSACFFIDSLIKKEYNKTTKLHTGVINGQIVFNH